jgi:hypothetical protein
MPSPAVLFASIFFGAIGLGAFIYGKKMMHWKAMSLGVALMVYPYFISQTWLLFTIGCVLCAGLFLFRD